MVKVMDPKIRTLLKDSQCAQGVALLVSCSPITDKYFSRTVAVVAPLSITPGCCLNYQTSNIKGTSLCWRGYAKYDFC